MRPTRKKPCEAMAAGEGSVAKQVVLPPSERFWMNQPEMSWELPVGL